MSTEYPEWDEFDPINDDQLTELQALVDHWYIKGNPFKMIPEEMRFVVLEYLANERGLSIYVQPGRSSLLH
jgi:hypothetical protein